MNNVLKVGVAGLGTVGGGVVKIIHDNAAVIKARCGKEIILCAVADLDKSKKETLPLDNAVWYDDALDMAVNSDADVIVELIGGSDGIAKKLCETSLLNHKHIVTANKALLANYGNELFALAKENKCQIAFEASVAGGIPVIKALREGLAANKIDYVYGIMNGTCNYILSTMRDTGKSFDDVLAEAQKLGYAEADPKFDVEGIDTAHKTAILASLAFDMPISFKNVYIEGIRHITPEDIKYADELGYRIKLLGIARKSAKGVEQRVHPCMIGASEAISNVEGVFNAVVINGDYVGRTVLEGRGAGEKPTASAVMSDIIDLASNQNSALKNLTTTNNPETIAMGDLEAAFYVRLTVIDLPGVIADVAAILKKYNISIENILQRNHKKGEKVTIVMTFHQAKEANVQEALVAIEKLESVVENPCMIRITNF
ncbi:MAG: homoserine dehydrogenase [Alphaproteobacteria bacterium]